MFLKSYENSFSDKMRWCPGFHKTDLVVIEMAKKKKVPDQELEIIKQEIQHDKNKPLRLTYLL